MRSRHSFRLIPLVYLFTHLATAQIQVHFGLEAGVPLTDTLSSSSQSQSSVDITNLGGPISSFNRYNSETKRLLIGPVFRVEIQSGLGIEVDALYQRVDFDFATFSQQPGTGAPTTQTFEQTTANRWQFPVLIQYTRNLPKWKMRWFAEAGPSISHIGDSRSSISSTTSSSSPGVSGTSTSSSSSNVTGQSATWAGITGGGGVDIPVSRLHLRPEFHYSHWFAQNGMASAPLEDFFAGSTTPIPAIPSFRIKQNEATFLLGLTF
jgi:hypothetical protein